MLVQKLVLNEDKVALLRERIISLMHQWSPCRDDSDYRCAFCYNRAETNDGAITHRDDCDGLIFLDMLVAKDGVQEMRLCEQSHLALRPNLLYHFTVDSHCEQCKKANEPYESEK